MFSVLILTCMPLAPPTLNHTVEIAVKVRCLDLLVSLNFYSLGKANDDIARLLQKRNTATALLVVELDEEIAFQRAFVTFLENDIANLLKEKERQK
jgi:hypothetical protein